MPESLFFGAGFSQHRFSLDLVDAMAKRRLDTTEEMS